MTEQISQGLLFGADPPQAPLKPFIKWAGGKGRLLKHLLPLTPSHIDDFYEPFLGGGAMFYALQGRVAGTSHLSDLNEELVNAWLAVRDHADELEEALKVHMEADDEVYYFEQRPLRPEGVVARAARFLYLNQTSWNGLWRVNKHGVFNVPWGQRAFRGLERDRMDRLATILDGVDISLADFRDVLPMAKAGDFVYLDPPYLPLSDTSKFHLYTEKRFRAPDLGELADLCDDLNERGVNWMMSNRDTVQVRDLFAHGTIVPLTIKRSVAAQNRRDVEPTYAAEAIVLGGPHGKTFSRGGLGFPADG